MKVLKVIGITLVLAVIAFVGYGLTLPTAYEMQRSTVIKATPAQIHQYTGELKNWEKWSPWQEADPSIKMSYGDKSSGVGASQSWDGDSGNGRMTVTQSNPLTGMSFDLAFEQDKYQAKSDMTYSPADGGTKVTWSMSGDTQIPVIGGYLTKMITSMTSDMYDKGLANLKTLVEKPVAP